jgi:IMP dehydrogenase
MEQAIEIDKVKRSENGVITNPFFSLAKSYNFIDEDELMGIYKISGVPVCGRRKISPELYKSDLRFEG